MAVRNYQFLLWSIFVRLLSGILFVSTNAVWAQKISAEANTQPNFVVFLLDDWGAGDASVYGNPDIKTPAIDSIAHAGIRFDNAFLTTSSCSASRASILTSRYPSQTGAPNLHDAIPKNSVLLSNPLKEHGYYTVSAGKWHTGSLVVSQFDKVIMSLSDANDTSGGSGAEDWLQVVKQRPKNKPFFLMLAANDPHPPYAELSEKSTYQDKSITVVPPYLLDSLVTQGAIAQYYNEIDRIDRHIGAVIKLLEQENILDNTYVFILSDNGAPFPRAKTTLYDSGIKTPFIVKGPGIKPQQVYSELVSSLDLAPTILTLANVPVPPSMQGLSFDGVLEGKVEKTRNDIYAEQFNHGHTIHKKALRNKHYLYIENIINDGSHCLLEIAVMREELVELKKRSELSQEHGVCMRRKWPKRELYDVNKDPFSLTNLLDETTRMFDVKESLSLKKHREIAQAMSELMQH